MTTLAIIQARMTSTRLPGKVMADVAGRPLLDHVIARARQAGAVDRVVVATSKRGSDDTIAEYCGRVDIPCFRGSHDDVLDRYYHAAQHLEAESIVRLTADCPLLDPAVIDKVVHHFRAGGHDYVSNALEPSYPDGLDTEAFRGSALERAWREAKLTSEREHVTAFIWKHPELFRVANVANDRDLSHLRWTVDEPEDLEFVRAVYSHLGPAPTFGMNDILMLLEDRPELGRINGSFERNEGFAKSLGRDKLVSGKRPE